MHTAHFVTRGAEKHLICPASEACVAHNAGVVEHPCMPSASHLPSAPRVRPVVDGLPAYVAGRSAQTALTAALASNESHFPPLPSVTSLMETETSRIHRYPDMASADLREAIAAHVDVSAEEVAVGPGSSGVLQQILSAVCDPGHEVVFAWRSFEAYPILAAVAGAEPVRVPLLPDEQHDLDAMAAAVTEQTRVLLLCSPNNPTGVPLDAERTEDLLSRVPPHVLVVIDEAYVEFRRRPVRWMPWSSIAAIRTSAC